MKKSGEGSEGNHLAPVLQRAAQNAEDSGQSMVPLYVEALEVKFRIRLIGAVDNCQHHGREEERGEADEGVENKDGPPKAVHQWVHGVRHVGAGRHTEEQLHEAVVSAILRRTHGILDRGMQQQFQQPCEEHNGGQPNANDIQEVPHCMLRRREDIPHARPIEQQGHPAVPTHPQSNANQQHRGEVPPHREEHEQAEASRCEAQTPLLAGVLIRQLVVLRPPKVPIQVQLVEKRERGRG
mmetsp:Transcript_112921/g.326199  ORF Transcript_112921/g.326199 Transcript_112921/m.326199 type:complete len:239 (+) Transcript_112921:1341-2057(+)